MTLEARIARYRERLAAVQHEIWAHWMQYLFKCCQPNEDGSVTIPADKVQRWRRQMDTDYSGLSEVERESDRHQADKVLRVLAEDEGRDALTERAIARAFDEGFQVATQDFADAVQGKRGNLSISPYAGTDPMLHRWWTRGYWYYANTLRIDGKLPACLEQQ